MTRSVTTQFDVSPPPSGESSLSAADVSQLSRILAQLTANQDIDGEGSNVRPFPLSHQALVTNHPQAKRMFDLRQRRVRFFPRSLFSEPAWDVLLVLYLHHGVSRLCIKDVAQLVDTPATTLLRWLKTLEDEKLISVRKHPCDRRVSLLDLTDLGLSSLAAYFQRTADTPD